MVSLLSAIVVINSITVPLLEAASCSTTTSTTPKPQNLRNRSGDGCAKILWEPVCDSDGTFSAVQCKGEVDNGRCFCYSTSGSKIFGWSWRWSSDEVITCRCSRQRHRLSTQLGRNDVSLHCTQNGNYEQLQCDNELCWCVEPTTGKPKERLYPRSMMQYLPCYALDSEDSSEISKERRQQLRYLRQCESKASARLAVIRKLEAHGRINTHIDEALCDPDGSYASYQFNKNSAYCVWKDSKKIDNYQSEMSNIRQMDCNCARDVMTYAEENLEMPMSCQGNGNYEALQMSNGRPYCVDRDGFPTTELCDFGENLVCPPKI